MAIIGRSEQLDLHVRLRDQLASATSGPIAEMLNQWATVYLAFARRRFVSLSRSGGSGDWPPLAPETVLRRRGGTKKLAQARKDSGYNRKAIQATVAGQKQKLSGMKARLIAAGVNKKRADQRVTALATAHAFGLLRRVGNAKIATRREVGSRLAASAANGAILRDTGTLFNALTIGMPGNVMQRIASGVKVGIGGPGSHGEGQPTIGEIACIHDQGKGHVPRRRIIVRPDDATLDRMKRLGAEAVKKLAKERR
jgi:hypothetical protein